MVDTTGNPPAGLSPRLAKALLDKLETDNDFRAAFAQSADKALRSLGFTGSTECLSLAPGATLATPAEIAAQRVKLEQTLVSIQQFTCPLESQQGS